MGDALLRGYVAGISPGRRRLWEATGVTSGAGVAVRVRRRLVGVGTGRIHARRVPGRRGIGVVIPIGVLVAGVVVAVVRRRRRRCSMLLVCMRVMNWLVYRMSHNGAHTVEHRPLSVRTLSRRELSKIPPHLGVGSGHPLTEAVSTASAGTMRNEGGRAGTGRIASVRHVVPLNPCVGGRVPVGMIVRRGLHDVLALVGISADGRGRRTARGTIDVHRTLIADTRYDRATCAPLRHVKAARGDCILERGIVLVLDRRATTT